MFVYIVWFRLEADIFSGIPRVPGFPWDSRRMGVIFAINHGIWTVQDKWLTGADGSGNQPIAKTTKKKAKSKCTIL